MIIDCFPFFNELDLLEIRLNSLAPYVDRFVLCEMPVTHSGNEKPLYFEANSERYGDFPITHIIAYEDKRYRMEPGKLSGDSWWRENYQRECLMNGLANCKPGDIILLSDIDEIPDLKNFSGEEGAFKQKMYYYYLNCCANMPPWKGTQSIRYGNITTLNALRNARNKRPTIMKDGGWHFSTLGNEGRVEYKIESFAHTEHNNDSVKRSLGSRIRGLEDPYGRGYRFHIEMPSGPKWLLDNQDKYYELFYHG
jgi:beta-1,4-mannosyl-glycoprotein beta-1,4-N-acetylglucosaminyltransferase